MQYGLMIFPTASGMPMAQLGPAAESRGFESLWVAEHSHIPASRKSPWPGGSQLPRMYFETLDPFVALTAAATTTTTLKVGTGICLVVQRDPIHTAKEVASLDQVSGGRFLFGVGGGWNIYMWPKPIQKPHPPIHVGGGFPGGARRALRYGNGWLPIAGRDDLESQMKEVRQLAEAEQRDPNSLEISPFGVEADPSAIERYANAGANRIVFTLPPADADTLRPQLDRIAKAVDEVGL